MSTARHHLEWQQLLDISGPWLSMPVLLRAFPDGLDKAEDASTLRARLHAAYDEWLDNQGGLAADPAIHRAWLRFVLREVLELEAALLVEGQAIPASCSVVVAEHQERLTPRFVLIDPPGRPSAGKPRMLIELVPRAQALDGPLAGARWKASPATRMMTLLHGAGVRLGLITNGEQWMMVHAAPNETTTYASFYANLFLEEPLTLRALQSLLGARRFFAVPDADTLEALFVESSGNQQEVTDQLGVQVRRAVEVLISGDEALVEFLIEETGRTKAAVQKAVAYQIPKEDRSRYLTVCENRAPLYQRIAPWAGLIRDDAHGRPVIFDEGSVYVTDGAERPTW